jgi:hypothetical protein
MKDIINNFSFPAIIKPNNLAKGKGVFPFSNKEECLKFFSEGSTYGLAFPSSSILLQEIMYSKHKVEKDDQYFEPTGRLITLDVYDPKTKTICSYGFGAYDKLAPKPLSSEITTESIVSNISNNRECSSKLTYEQFNLAFDGFFSVKEEMYQRMMYRYDREKPENHIKPSSHSQHNKCCSIL